MEAHFMVKTHNEKAKSVFNSGEEKLCINIHE